MRPVGGRRRWPAWLATALLAVSLPFAAPALANDASAPITLTILHTNDMHGHVLPEIDKSVAPDGGQTGGAAYLAGYIERLYKEHPGSTLLIDSGDIAQGTPISNMFYGKPVVDFMNAMPYDAGTIGNHEFDWGRGALDDMLAADKRPIVCANLRLRVGAGHMPAHVRDFVLRRVAGIVVGITGLVTPDTPHISFKRNTQDYEFLEPAAVMREVLPRMRAAGAQFIVVASHLGLQADEALAREVPGIGVIVGGHSHTVLSDPVMVNGTVIVQAGKYMKFLGDLNVKIDPHDGHVLDYTHQHELVAVVDAKVTPDAHIASLIDGYQKQVGPAMAQVVGQAAGDLTKHAAPGCGDTAIGDVIADSLRWKLHTDVAIYNFGGIRSELNAGPIKMSDVYTLLPFDNYAVALSLSGKQLLALLAQGLTGDHGTVQVSGLTMDVDAAGNPQHVLIGGKPLEPDRSYRVATIDFLAEGNDGYTVFREARDRTTDELARDVFTAYLSQAGPLQPPPPGRIKKL
jgi:2',3'-cyclic-nucleotide 2'-phosphodiesterase (5'-nucleotidase family)